MKATTILPVTARTPRAWAISARHLGALAARCLLGIVLCAGIVPASTAQTPPAQTPPAEARAEQGQSPQRLRVLTIERRPFAVKSDQGFKGFSIDLWTRIAAEMELPFELVEAPTFKDMLEGVRTGQADAAVANISITAEREVVLDFSHPIYDSGLQIMINESATGGGLLGALFSWHMVGLVLSAGALVMALGLAMWFFERRRNEFFNKPLRQSWWISFWWALQRVLSGGFEMPVPATIPGRIIGVLTSLTALFLVSAFVATITSSVTVNELKSDIETVSDLQGKRVGTTRASTAARYLADQQVAHREFDSLPTLFDALHTGKLDAVVHDAPVLAYHATEAGLGKVRVTGAIFKPEKYGIALQDGSPLAEPINRALLKLREDGTYDVLLARYFGGSR